ncbi:hypothetical protein WL51_03580 [Burkholderia ubonensis]|uniref:Tc toxin subunit A-related protein n=1 Tax=Burkholderia ubonensis TaxID=101571 RepID=UPI00075D58B7|nr:hypothetical protein [Burkholderia ubonensis]KWC42430.1 hypothetical protein WL51_03580 [Burkholderia ubonensis]
MSNARFFHGSLDTYFSRLQQWRIVSQERKYAHSVQYARRLVYKFSGHTHPYAQRLMSELIIKDIQGLERLDTDVDLRRTYFLGDYAPSKVIERVDPALCGSDATAVVAPHKSGSSLAEDGLPVDDLDFDYQNGAYSVYNWELFYHVPYTLGLHLSRNGRFADAQRWFHYIFDPTDNSDPAQGPKRFWKVKPFRIDEVEHVENELFNLATGDDPVARDGTARAIAAWRDSPFRPHLVARSRPTAYMYATVMAYLDNLIAWGDSLFQQDTRESINEAMQLYVLAANILGPRPQEVPARGKNRKQTYASLKNELDEFGNAAVAIEAEIGFDLFPPPTEADARPEHTVLESIGRSLYFCVPRNEKLIGYWDTVGDRLYKIRNSLNLQGIFRQLPLFAPPIDPAMLARAVAAGVDVESIVAGTAGAILPVRFQVLLQRAVEMAQEVKSLGSQVLSALEKRDGEALGVLRARHELRMLDLGEAVKYAQWQEAIKAREGVTVNLQNAFQRFRHYHRLLGTDDGQIKLPDYTNFDRDQFEQRNASLDESTVDAPDADVRVASSFRDGNHKVSDEEAHELDLLEATQIAREVAKVIGEIGSTLNLIPNVEASAKPWGLGAGVTFGGSQLGNFFGVLSLIAQHLADRTEHEAHMAGRMASFARREQDWALQRKAAAGELSQLYKQFRSAEIREYIAKREHEHHLTQVQQSRDVLEFLTNEQDLLSGDQRKTTTEDFYLWMKREARGLHARYFQLALEMARKAESALQYELGDTSLSFIQTGYLAGKEGLFAGERLWFDLKRLEIAFDERNRREYELTRHVSLREWFPLQLIAMRLSGKCQIELPEQLFDLDCPGHSFRRIKSVALSIPCVTGPYASVSCALMLSESFLRHTAAGYGNDPRSDDTNFIPYQSAVKSVVTSTGQADTGLFEVNLRDERYLPFEGAGVISAWSLELLGQPRSFDYDTIADVVLTIRYTARPEGNRAEAEKSAAQWLKTHAARVFSMRHEFSTEWAGFKRPRLDGEGPAVLKFSLTPDQFPFRMEKVTENPKRLHLFFSGNADGDVELRRNGTSLGKTALASGMAFVSNALQMNGDYELQFESNAVDDLWVVVDWQADEA